MKKILLFLILNFSLLILNSFSQPAIQWQRCLGGSNTEYAYSIEPTTDGGYIVAGYTYSTDGNVTGNHGGADYWVVKLDGLGNLLWQKCLGGSGDDEAYSIQQTVDSGYIVSGSARSNDGDVTGNYGNTDCWVVKLDNAGTLQWQKCLGGTLNEGAQSIQQTVDGGYILVATANSNNGDVMGLHSVDTSDYWVVKLDSSGILQWQKCIGGTHYDEARDIQQTVDGGYIVFGKSRSINGDATGNNGSYDYWVVKLDNSGTLQWQKNLGGTGADEAKSIQQTTDGGYIVVGYTNSNNGDVTGNHGLKDYWVVKLDSSGILQWQKCLGGTSDDEAFSIKQTIDGGYIVAGGVLSNDSNVTGNNGNYDYWVVKLDGSGILQWQKCLGGTLLDGAYSIGLTADGGFIVAGFVSSNDGDVTGNNGMRDCWVVKLAPLTGIEVETSNELLNIFPNPANNQLTIEKGQRTIESIEIYDVTGREVYSENHQTQNSNPEIIIDISKFPVGVYVVRVQTTNFNETTKLIVAK